MNQNKTKQTAILHCETRDGYAVNRFAGLACDCGRSVGSFVRFFFVVVRSVSC